LGIKLNMDLEFKRNLYKIFNFFSMFCLHVVGSGPLRQTPFGQQTVWSTHRDTCRSINCRPNDRVTSVSNERGVEQIFFLPRVVESGYEPTTTYGYSRLANFKSSSIVLINQLPVLPPGGRMDPRYVLHFFFLKTATVLITKTTTEASFKSPNLESAEFWNFLNACLAKFKKLNFTLYNKIIRQF